MAEAITASGQRKLKYLPPFRLSITANAWHELVLEAISYVLDLQFFIKTINVGFADNQSKWYNDHPPNDYVTG
jgi:hypothetical protein